MSDSDEDLYNTFEYLKNHTKIVIQTEKYTIDEIQEVGVVIGKLKKCEELDNQRVQSINNLKKDIRSKYNSYSTESCRFCSIEFVRFLNPSLMCNRCFKEICCICSTNLPTVSGVQTMCPACCTDLLLDSKAGVWFKLESSSGRYVSNGNNNNVASDNEAKTTSVKSRRKQFRIEKQNSQDKLRDPVEKVIEDAFKEKIAQQETFSETWMTMKDIIRKLKYKEKQRHLNQIVKQSKEEQASSSAQINKTESVDGHTINSSENSTNFMDPEPLIFLNLFYNTKEAKLYLHVQKCQDLPEINKKQLNIQIRVNMEPMASKVKIQSKVCKGRNPVFNEKLVMKLSEAKQATTNLIISVVHITDVQKRKINLAELVITVNHSLQDNQKTFIPYRLKNIAYDENKTQNKFKNFMSNIPLPDLKISSDDDVPLIDESAFLRSSYIFIRFRFIKSDILVDKVTVQLHIVKFTNLDALITKATDIKIEMSLCVSKTNGPSSFPPISLRFDPNEDSLIARQLSFESCEHFDAIEPSLDISVSQNGKLLTQASASLRNFIGSIGINEDWHSMNLKLEFIP